MDDLDIALLARLQHPTMAAFHPWLIGAAYTLLAIGVALALWGLLANEHGVLRATLGSLAAGTVMVPVAAVFNPIFDADERFRACCLLAMLVMGLCAVWEYFGQWSFRPFRFLVWVPPAVDLGKAALTIPAHLRSSAEQAVVLLNQVPDP
jgi:hypothetical protein